MKTLSYTIASLLVLFTVAAPVALMAQSPTVASGFSIENPEGDRVTLDIPNTGVIPYTLFFPASAPTPGSLFLGTAGGGTTDWLAAGAAGTVLQIGSSGTPEWSSISTLPGGTTPNSTLIWNGTDWVENTNVTMTPGGDVTTAGDLTVNGTNVTLPAGSVDNSELANSSINLTYGGGLSGDASVVLGGTLNLQNDGVTGLTAGDGISLSGSTGNVTVTNDGILDVQGTTNQVNVSTTAGVATLSTPQDIHTGASPTFLGMTLTGLTGSSASSEVLVLNGSDQIETRTIYTLPGGSTPNSTLIWNGTNWVENTNVTMTPGGDVTTAGDLTVNGTNVTLPAGSVDNSELANSSVTVTAGTGLSGGGTVALGGAITLNNDGILTVSGTGSGIDVQTAGGAVTVENTGVTSITGTPNQVVASASTGAVTLSAPQDIHTDATPTFDGLILDNLTGASSSSNVLVLNGSNAVETRTIYTLPGGSTPNSTLIWNGTNWVENTNVTMTPTGDVTMAGDLTVSGTNVTLPSGSVDNSELANSSINVSYGSGLSGDASVSLGGTLNVQNTGVTGLTAGSGISVSGSTGNVTVTNNGILDVQGTTNQVNVSTTAGVATLSTPQNIHTDAVPTFDGLILDNMSSGSASTDIVVSNGGTLETRSLGSLTGSSGRISTSTATNGGSGWNMTISDTDVATGNTIIVTYEDPAGGSNKTVHVVNRSSGSSFDVQFSGKPATGSYVNYYILP